MSDKPEIQNDTHNDNNDIQNETQPKKSGLSWLLPISGVAILAAGGAAAYYYLTAGSRATPLETAAVIPDEALVAAYVTANESTWSQLRQFGTPEAQKIIGERLKARLEESRSQTNIDFEEDLKPWVGDVMFALLPAADPESDAGMNVLVAVNIKDKIKALNFSKRLEAQEEGDVTESEYKGVTISQVTEPNGATYSLAVLGDRLVLSFQDATVRASIDTFKGEPSLASLPAAEQLFEEGAELDTPLAQVYVTDYAGFIQQSIAASEGQAPVSPEALQQLEQVNSIVFGVGIDELGVRVRGLARFEGNADRLQFGEASGEIISQFPANTLALVSGIGINNFWNQVVSRGQVDPSVQQVVDRIRTTLSKAQLDADREVFGWMDGEFAIGIVPSPQGIAQTGVGGAIFLQTSDRELAAATLPKLQNIAKNNIAAPIDISDRDINGTKVTDWNLPGLPGPLLSYGWLQEDTVFLALGGFADVVVGDPETPLGESEPFARITDRLPKPNAGYVYFNGQQTLQFIQMAGQTGQIPPGVMAGVSSVTGWVATIAMPEPTLGQFDLAIALVENEQ